MELILKIVFLVFSLAAAIMIQSNDIKRRRAAGLPDVDNRTLIGRAVLAIRRKVRASKFA
jgi:hypothetical protein